MMGAAMLKCHQFVQSLWASYGVWLVEMCMWGSQEQPLFILKYYVICYFFTQGWIQGALGTQAPQPPKTRPQHQNSTKLKPQSRMAVLGQFINVIFYARSFVQTHTNDKAGHLLFHTLLQY